MNKVLPLAILAILWELVSVYAEYRRGVSFPDPLDTCETLLGLVSGQKVSDASIYAHLRDSLFRWVQGFLTASLFGVLYGFLAGWSKKVKTATWPLVHVLQMIPGLAWIPVALLIFGIGEAATVFMIAVTAFTPIAMNVFSGVVQVDRTFIRAARMMGANSGTIFLRVLIPGALPSLISGLRIGLGNGWRVLVAGEMVVGTGTGLGYAIIQARWTLDYESAFACLVIICLIGLLVENLIFRPVERMTIEKWSA